MSKRYLLLGRTEVDVRWLEIDARCGHVTHTCIIPVRLYKEMPHGYVGPAKGYTVNANFSPMSLDVEPGTWLNIVPEEKLPPTMLTALLP